MVQIFVKRLTNGQTIVFYVEPGETVRNVKERIATIENMPAESVFLFYAGKNMQDELNMSDYNIQLESTIHVVGRLNLDKIKN